MEPLFLALATLTLLGPASMPRGEPGEAEQTEQPSLGPSAAGKRPIPQTPPASARGTEPLSAPADEGSEQTAKDYDIEVILRVFVVALVHDTHPSAEQPQAPETTARLQIRQTRVKINARYKTILWARTSFDVDEFLEQVEPGDVLRDAWINIRMHDAVQLKIGRFKRPYSRLELRSTSKVPFVDRGLYNGFAVEELGWGDRALGAALWGEIEPRRPGLHHAEWSVSASNHAFAGAPEGIDVHARGAYDPLPWLSVAFGGAFKSVEDPAQVERRVFGASGDLTARWKDLYASMEVDAAQDWTYEDFSPWVVGALGYVSYEWDAVHELRLQPVLSAEFIDANLSYAQSEAWRFLVDFNVLWKQHLRVMPQVEIIRPRAPVTDFNRTVAQEIYGVWLFVQL